MSAPLRVAVIGVGWGGQLHLGAYGKCPGAEVVAVCSRTRSSAEEVASRFGVPSVYTDFEEMASSEQPDVVSVATPTSSHRQYTLAAAERGCHVLCDKPVAMSVPEAEEMLRAVEAQGVRHATGFVSDFTPDLLKMRSLVAEGMIGEVREFHCRSALGGPILPMTWMYDADAGGGALLQHGQHLIEWARLILGDEITAVCGELTYDVKEAEVGPTFHNVFDAYDWAMKRMLEGGGEELPKAPVTAETGFDFAASLRSGARAHFWEAWHSASVYTDQVEVFGSRGTLVWSPNAGLRLVRGRRPPEQIEVEGGEAGGDPRQTGARHWATLVQAFVDDIRGADHPRYPNLHDGCRVQQVCDAVFASDKSRAWERVPAAQQVAAG
jgi:predicted dehydrogenase